MVYEIFGHNLRTQKNEVIQITGKSVTEVKSKVSKKYPMIIVKCVYPLL